MSVTTVLGDINESELGVTSVHEHMFIDMRHCVVQTGNEPDLFFEKFEPSKRAYVCSDPYAILDNALMDEFDIALKELVSFKKAGGNTIVDCTLDEIGRNPLLLKKLSELSGINIVVGCGNYYHIAHPDYVNKETVEQLADRIYNDLTVGIGDSGVRAGVIGEIGTSAVMSADEKKVLRAAGMVASQTGRPVHVHTDLYTENGFEVINILRGEGVNPDKICIDHVDVFLRPDYIKALLELGVFVEFDNFGKEFYVSEQRRFAYDLERIRVLKELVDCGYTSQILVSNDICLKSMLETYGGNGYTHILNTVRYMAEQNGIESQYDSMLTDNVKRFFS